MYSRISFSSCPQGWRRSLLPRTTAGEIPAAAFAMQPNPDCVLAFDETNDSACLVLGRSGYQHVDMVGHHMPTSNQHSFWRASSWNTPVMLFLICFSHNRRLKLRQELLKESFFLSPFQDSRDIFRRTKRMMCKLVPGVIYQFNFLSVILWVFSNWN